MAKRHPVMNSEFMKAENAFFLLRRKFENKKESTSITAHSYNEEIMLFFPDS
jgi:hypothetical protein